MKLLEHFASFFLLVIACWSFTEFTLGIFHWLTSKNDIEKKTAAKQRVKKGVIVFGGVILAWAVSILWNNFVGITFSDSYLVIPEY